jgi:hypothetical protein
MSALLSIAATVWKVPALRWPALVLAGMLALWGYVEIAEWRAGNEAVEEAVQETKDDMEDLKNAARDGRDAFWRCTRAGGVYDLGTGRCESRDP